jgi:uncharacterized membrane protein
MGIIKNTDLYKFVYVLMGIVVLAELSKGRIYYLTACINTIIIIVFLYRIKKMDLSFKKQLFLALVFSAITIFISYKLLFFNTNT